MAVLFGGMWLHGLLKRHRAPKGIKCELLAQIRDDHEVIEGLLKRNPKFIWTCKDLERTRLNPEDLRELQTQIVAQMPAQQAHWFYTEVGKLMTRVDEHLADLKKLPQVSDSMSLNKCWDLADELSAIREALEHVEADLDQLRCDAAARRTMLTTEFLTEHCDAASETLTAATREAFGYRGIALDAETQRKAIDGMSYVADVRRLIADVDFQQANQLLEQQVWPRLYKVKVAMRKRDDAQDAILLEFHKMRVKLRENKEKAALGRDTVNPTRTLELLAAAGEDFEVWAAKPGMWRLGKIERQQALDFIEVRIMSAFMYGRDDVSKEDARQFAVANS